jgi:hypothetical protein
VKRYPYGAEATAFATDGLNDAVKSLATFSNKLRGETDADALADDALAVV